MLPESAAEFYRDTLERVRCEMAEAESEEERQACAEVIVTCQLRLAGVP